MSLVLGWTLFAVGHSEGAASFQCNHFVFSPWGLVPVSRVRFCTSVGLL